MTKMQLISRKKITNFFASFFLFYDDNQILMDSETTIGALSVDNRFFVKFYHKKETKLKLTNCNSKYGLN